MGGRLGWFVFPLFLVLGVAHAQPGTVTYVYVDPLGTPLAEADANGNITATFDYRPYGSQALGSPPAGPGYAGHVNDPDTELVYMQARYYDPAAGRFLSRDPVSPRSGDLFNFGRYTYVNNNPARFIDPDGRVCKTTDGKVECTFDSFKDKGGNTISREQALSSGSGFAKFFHADMGSRILRAEAVMTAKYSAAKDLAAKGGQVTIKGSEKLAIPDQQISGTSIVSHMETMQTIATAQTSPIVIASTPPGPDGAPSDGPITFFNGGGKSQNLGQIFGHEILHTLYSGVDLPNHGWANPQFNLDHQTPFNDASDAIQ
ncbi:RHS repeat-associated core domain-containing protein [Dyella sp. OK004]|uniref:RHS repeat domain-containing protein n=1 Tax=Dyella sp. OK004 TaxID=1855292 RepID=UPI0008F305B9|nr:RHS repeat-associated core domain-containing protein [Dyella sp. OK004]SFR94311.1 RHS repeat-associated core domain-containing protein [Dyella sp. OK004]